MQALNNIIYKILSLQEKILKYRLSKTIGVKTNSKRKRHFGKGCLLDLNSIAEAEKQKLEEELTLIIKNCSFEPEKMLKYVQKQGTKVIYSKDANKILNPIGENEGFIYPENGAKALYLALSFLKEFKLKTPEMFIVPEGDINKYYFIYHFYNWFAFKHNIEGVDSQSQKLLKKYLYSNESTNNLQLSEIYKLKDAIRQDKASIDFVINICKKFETSKQALNKIKNSGSATV